jgi:hypothetical protein
MSDDAQKPRADDAPGAVRDSAASDDSFWDLMDHLRIDAFERIWPEKAGIRALLTSARVNLNNYPLSGDTARDFWSALLPDLYAQGELAKVLRVIGRDVSEKFQQDVAVLLELLEKKDRDNASVRESFRLAATLEAAWDLLRKGSEHQVALLQTVHPNRSRIEMIRTWIQDCVKTIHNAQETSPEARTGVRAQLDDIATRLAQVVDDFHIYASMLERFQRANRRIVGESAQSPALSAIAEDERLLISCRGALRTSIADLTAVLGQDQDQ